MKVLICWFFMRGHNIKSCCSHHIFPILGVESDVKLPSLSSFSQGVVKVEKVEVKIPLAR